MALFPHGTRRLTVYATSADGSTCFGLVIVDSITLRKFTRAVAHEAVFGIPKQKIRMSKLNGDGTWTRLICFRSITPSERSFYDAPLSSLGVFDNAQFKVERVISRRRIRNLVIGGIVTAVSFGLIGLTVAGGILLWKERAAHIQTAFDNATPVILPDDMPRGILEIRRIN